MLIFNCSRAAALHLSPGYRKVNNESVFEPADTITDTVAERSKHHDGNIMQWVVHAVKVGRSTCLIAMEYETRWVHVIHKAKKGDIGDFVNRLNTRLVNAIDWITADYSLFDEQEFMEGIDAYFNRHHDLVFIQQTDRSVMAHISQVAQQYDRIYNDIGHFPEDETQATSADLHFNQWWRQINSDGYHTTNTVECRMLAYWMKNMMNRSNDDIDSAVTRMGTAHVGGVLTSLEEMPVEEKMSNVIEITSRINKKSH